MCVLELRNRHTGNVTFADMSGKKRYQIGYMAVDVKNVIKENVHKMYKLHM